jgi:hypothetical protein
MWQDSAMASRRLLIAVGEAADDLGELPFGIRTLIEGADEILVITPRLPVRLDWLASATDKATEQADDRLQEVMGQLEEVDAPVSGDVGADDPLLAFDDAVAAFGPSHILIALRASDQAGWQERGLLDQVRTKFRLPLTTFELSS